MALDIIKITPLSERDIEKKMIEKQGQIEHKEPQANDILSKGLLQFIIQRHPELVHEFLKDNGMDGLYSIGATSRIPEKSRAAALLV